MRGNTISSMNAFDLTELGVLHVDGQDAAEFLAAQLTSDVAQLEPNRGQLSAWCNPQGRVLTLFRLYRREQDFYLFAPRPMIAASLQRMKMFVLRADVMLTDRSDDTFRYGLSGSGATATVSTLTGVRPPDPACCATGDDCNVFGFADRYIVLGEQPSEALRDVATGEFADWRLLDIQAGIPNVYPETTEQFLPQMLNLDVLDGLSFSKGCYPGQEIIARLKFRGELKRRMCLAAVNTPTCPVPGGAIRDSDGPDSAGTVVDAQPLADGESLLLAVLRNDLTETQRMHLEDREGPLLKLQPLPYAVL